jgi:hypothetical protein
MSNPQTGTESDLAGAMRAMLDHYRRTQEGIDQSETHAAKLLTALTERSAKQSGKSKKRYK